MTPKLGYDGNLLRIQKHIPDASVSGLLTLTSCFLVNFLAGGLANTFGLFYPHMQDSLDVEEYPLTWIGSMQNGCFGGLSLLGSVLIETLGIRQTTLAGGLMASAGLIASSQTSNLYVLYLTFGFLPGVGLVFAYMSTLIGVTNEFEKWRPLAFGIAVTGFALGNLVMPPVTSFLINTYTWRNCILIHGALFMNIVPCALTLKTQNNKLDETTRTQNGKRSLFRFITKLLELFKNSGTVAFCFSRLFYGLGVFAYATFVPEYAASSIPDLSPSDVALTVSLLGIGNLAGRMVFGGMSMLTTETGLGILIICMAICGIFNFLVVTCSDFLSFLITGLMYGISLGGYTSLLTMATAYVFGIENLHKALGVSLTCQGVGSLAGPPLQSYVAARTGYRDLVFYLSGGFYVMGFLVLLPTLCRSFIKDFKGKSFSLRVTPTDEKSEITTISVVAKPA